MRIALRVILSLPAACAAVILVYVLFVAWAFYYGVEAERAPFSSEAWKDRANVYAINNDPGCVRGGMALDIVATRMLQGKARVEMESLLGAADGTKSGEPYYELGQCSGLGWHDSILQVYFHDGSQVADTEIQRHQP
jgi:hypothetical protein